MLWSNMESKPESKGDVLNLTNVHKNEDEEEVEIPFWMYDESDIRPFTEWSTTNELKFTNEVIVTRLYALARVVHDTFTNTGICYWTSGGTTLGCVRHQGLIPWDDDLDLCIYQKDEGVKLEEAKRLLNEKGFDIIEAPSFGYRAFHKTDSDSFPDNFQQHRYPFCDIFVMRQEGIDKCSIADRCGRTLWPEEFYNTRDIDNMEQRPFGNLYLNCPANAEDYLCRTYGEKWRTEGVTHSYDHITRSHVKPVKFILDKDLCQPAKPFCYKSYCGREVGLHGPHKLSLFI